jgi:hypothetical protein
MEEDGLKWEIRPGRKPYPDPPHEQESMRGVTILSMWVDEAALLPPLEHETEEE